MYVRTQLVLEIQQNCMLTWSIRLLSVKNEVTRHQYIFGTRQTIRNLPGTFQAQDDTCSFRYYFKCTEF